MSERRDVIVSERGSRLRMLKSVRGMLKGLPRMLVPRKVILMSTMLFGNPMGMGGTVVRLGGSLMVLVMRSVVIASGHISDTLDPP